MRDIRFRQWDSRRKIYYRDIGATDGCWSGAPYVSWETYPLEQYTGLKDRDGREIYEGDVCKFDVTEIQGLDCIVCDIIGEVSWDENDAGFFFLTKSNFPHVKPWFTKNIKIIGNVHENPELLEDN
jgi:uncharacterized phage protein (TIGR01671 family)